MTSNTSEGEGGAQEGRRDDGRRVSIGVIGDGSLAEESPKREVAEELGERLVDAGYRIVCGGLAGVMEAVCRGAHRSEQYVEGTTVGVVPGDRPAEANPYVDVALSTDLGHYRNGIVAQSQAVVAVGGGAGTLSELAFAWIKDRMIVGMEVDGWSGRLAGQRLDERRRVEGFGEDRIFEARTPEQAVALLGEHIGQYV